MVEDAVEGLLGGAVALAGVAAEELLGRGEQRPSPAVLVAVLVAGIDEVLGDDAAGHLQAGDVAVEAAAHPGLGESAQASQVTGDEAAVLTQGHEDGLLDTAGGWGRVGMAAPVVEVGPPVAADEAGLLVEELAIDAVALGDDGPFPVPQWPVPAAVVKEHIAALGVHGLVGAVAGDAAIEQGQESHLLDVAHELGRGMYVRAPHGLLSQDLVEQGVDVFLALVGVDVEIGVAGEHGRELRLAAVVEDVAGNAAVLGIGEFVAHAQRRAGALADEEVALAQPRGVLVIDAGVAVASLLGEAQVAVADVLGEHYVGALDIGDDAAVEVGIDTPATYGPCKIDFLCHSVAFVFFLFWLMMKLQR